MTKEFKRSFVVDSLTDHFKNQGSLIGALLDRWALPGQPGRNGQTPLRLAVRNGYFNLYADGQSVAKISSRKNGPRLEVHWKYLEKFPITEQHVPGGKTYLQFEGNNLLIRNARDQVDQWIETARHYAGSEKRFVEHLVARNANVIDLEMGLPGDPDYRPHGSEKVGLSAPRMDLVVAHLGKGAPIINFWEAKLANNPELRATLPENGGAKRPHVCDQIDNYATWLAIIGRSAQVRTAYRESANISVDLAHRAGKAGEATEVWCALAECDPEVNPRAGVVIGNYRPETRQERFPEADSFKTRGHQQRLLDLKFKLREVEGLDCPEGKISKAIAGGAV